MVFLHYPQPVSIVADDTRPPEAASGMGADTKSFVKEKEPS
jgi:hypothetical protein